MTGPGTTPPPSGQAPGGGGWNQPPAGSPGGPAAAGGFQLKPVEAGPAPGVAYADLGIRIGAFIIDAVILTIGFWILFFIVGAIFVTSAFDLGLGIGLVLLVVLGAGYLVGSAVYYVYTWTTMRASPGQRMLGLETVNAGNGATLTQPQAIRRWAFLYGVQAVVTVLQISAPWFVFSLGFFGALAPLLSLLGLAYAIYLLYTTSQSGKRQGFHDVQAGTVVVKRVA